MNLEPLKHQITLARMALEEAQRFEKENGYEDAMLSMERAYCEGSLDSLEYAYTLLNGVPFEND